MPEAFAVLNKFKWKAKDHVVYPVQKGVLIFHQYTQEIGTLEEIPVFKSHTKLCSVLPRLNLVVKIFP